MIENKTIFIAHNWSDASVNQQSKYLAYQLSEKNKVIFLSAKKNGFHEKQINSNLIIYEWPGKRPVGFKDLLFCYRLHKKYKPDIGISHFAANNIMLFVSWLMGVPNRLAYYHTTVQQYVADTGKLGIKQKLNILIKRFFFNKATHFICPSSYSAKSAVSDYGINKKKVFVIPNALPDKNIRNVSNNQDIGFLGRLNKSKGVDILVRAFILIAHKVPSAKLLIAGKGEEEQALKEMLLKNGLENRVVWLGQVGYDKIFDFLSNLNCLIVPSRIDNLPTVVLEAFSCATPVIAARTGGIADMVEDDRNGFLFENENEASLAEKMMLLLTNQHKRDQLAQQAQQIFRDKFLIDHYPNNLLSVIGKI